jgi:hypothetical protein
VLIAAAAAAWLAIACSGTQRVAFVNPNDEPLFVSVDERQAFEVPPGGKVERPLPSIEQLVPITIIARDRSGATVFFQTTSARSISQGGRRVELVRNSSGLDPSSPAAPYLSNPYLSTPAPPP